MLLCFGYDVILDLVQHKGTNWGWNMGHVNASGQVPDIPNLPSLIDNDTPDEIKNSVRTGFNGRDYQLVFSDEFNTDGRTFFPGDDPFVSHFDYGTRLAKSIY